MNRTDLADPTAGVLATLEGHQPVAVFERGGGRGEVSFELESQSLGQRAEIAGSEMLGNWSVEAQVLRGRLRGSDGSTTPIEAIGAHSQGASVNGHEPALASLRRAIVICLEDGGLLAVFAARGKDREHGDEERAAVWISGDGERSDFSEIRISTEYGPDGGHRRATLELWTDEPGEGPLRAAGIAVAGARVNMEGARSDLGFFEWSVAGSPGIGRYEIIRAL